MHSAGNVMGMWKLYDTRELFAAGIADKFMDCIRFF